MVRVCVCVDFIIAVKTCFYFKRCYHLKPDNILLCVCVYLNFVLVCVCVCVYLFVIGLKRLLLYFSTIIHFYLSLIRTHRYLIKNETRREKENHKELGIASGNGEEKRNVLREREREKIEETNNSPICEFLLR